MIYDQDVGLSRGGNFKENRDQTVFLTTIFVLGEMQHYCLLHTGIY